MADPKDFARKILQALAEEKAASKKDYRPELQRETSDTSISDKRRPRVPGGGVKSIEVTTPEGKKHSYGPGESIGGGFPKSPERMAVGKDTTGDIGWTYNEYGKSRPLHPVQVEQPFAEPYGIKSYTEPSRGLPRIPTPTEQANEQSAKDASRKSGMQVSKVRNEMNNLDPGDIGKRIAAAIRPHIPEPSQGMKDFVKRLGEKSEESQLLQKQTDLGKVYRKYPDPRNSKHELPMPDFAPGAVPTRRDITSFTRSDETDAPVKQYTEEEIAKYRKKK